jgi:hypothetical protein
LLALVALLFCTAPTPGDVGGCSQPARELDAPVFFASKDFNDCQHCKDCQFHSAICERACSNQLSQSAFPKDCLPLVHDGEVCLRALQSASCDEYRAYVRDQNTEVPTECNFCPAR